MFGPVSTTRYDLQFRLFGIPVHVTPWFWLGGVILAWGLMSEGRYDLMAIWLACLFVSILVHEFGHAFCAESFGCPPEIYLYQFGGLAVFRPNYRFTTTRSVIVSFAGPAAGFVLYGAVFLLAKVILSSEWFARLDRESAQRVGFFLTQMEWINLWWGLVNLLPVLPLDGGRIAEAILLSVRQRDGRRLAVLASAVVSGGVALFCLMHDEKYGALLFGLLCITNVQSLQHRSPW
jgi:stage IV sporulation protein FB